MDTLKRLIPVALLLIAQAASAADAPPIVLTSIAEREVVSTDADGNQVTTMERVTSAVPSDVIVYTITYANNGTDAADNVVITDPIPAEMAYVGGSAFGAGADLVGSADGGLSWGPLNGLTFTGADGQTRPARPDEITHLRWTLRNPVPPGGRGFVRFKAAVR
jgi:uncharacterized repeat protein (TIGR01451 family)